MSLTPVNITRLEKAAMDNGFDLDRGRDGDWLVFDGIVNMSFSVEMGPTVDRSRGQRSP